MFDSNEGIASRTDADQFIQLDLDRGAVAVLGILDQEHHQKRYNRGARIDDKLPGVGIAEQRPWNSPHYHHAGSNDERRGAPRSLGRPVGDIAKHLGDSRRPLLALLRLLARNPQGLLLRFAGPTHGFLPRRAQSARWRNFGLAAFVGINSRSQLEFRCWIRSVAQSCRPPSLSASNTSRRPANALRLPRYLASYIFPWASLLPRARSGLGLPAEGFDPVQSGKELQKLVGNADAEVGHGLQKAQQVLLYAKRAFHIEYCNRKPA